MTRVLDLHKKWMKDPEYAEAYHALDEEFTHAATAGRNLARRSRKRGNAADDKR
jgi:hypothetical protein